MSKQNFEQFQQHVAQTPDLQERLKQTTNRADFVALVVQLGNENGYDFTAEEVEAAIATSQASTQEAGELDEEQLATVAGGAFSAGVKSGVANTEPVCKNIHRPTDWYEPCWG